MDTLGDEKARASRGIDDLYRMLTSSSEIILGNRCYKINDLSTEDNLSEKGQETAPSERDTKLQIQTPDGLFYIAYACFWPINKKYGIALTRRPYIKFFDYVEVVMVLLDNAFISMIESKKIKAIPAKKTV